MGPKTRGGITTGGRRGLRSSPTRSSPARSSPTRSSPTHSKSTRDIERPTEDLMKNRKPAAKKPAVNKKQNTVKVQEDASTSSGTIVSTTKRKRGGDGGPVEANAPTEVGDFETKKTKIFKTMCRPGKLVELISNFSDEQKKAVVDIGFGGLLSVKLTRTKTSMLGWLVQSFDHSSCMLTIDQKRDFVVSEYDVYDVFCLPLNPMKDVVEISRSNNETNPDYPLKLEWRHRFGYDNNEQIPLNLVEERISLLTDGGDEFKQLFVLHVFSSFLAPTPNRTVDLKIAKSLVDVNQIRTYNWSKYVLDKLCEGIASYKGLKYSRPSTSKSSPEWCGGCVLLLEIVYFHRLKFRNVALDSTLPLIQHWTKDLVRERVILEKSSKSYGSGILDSSIYPVSEKLMFVDGHVYKGKDAGVEHNQASVNEGSGKDDIGQTDISFKLPPGSMSDDEIRHIAVDSVYEKFLFMKRDLEVVSNFYMEKIRELLHSTNSGTILPSPSMSQSDVFFMDPRVHAIVDEIAELVTWVTKLPGGLDNIAAFENCMNKENQGPSNPEVSHCNSVYEDNVIPLIGFEHFLKNDRAKCSAVIWKAPDDGIMLLVSPFMKLNNKDMQYLSQLVQELVDYCVINGECMVMNEQLVSYYDKYVIQRNEFCSLGEPSEDIHRSIIDCWAVLLNENQKNSKEGARKLYLGVSMSFTLLDVASSVLENTETGSQQLDSLHQSWKKWIELPSNDFDLSNVELVFVPVLYYKHCFLLVINIKKGKVQFLGNKTYSKAHIDTFKMLAVVLCENFSTFIDDKFPKVAQQMLNYSMVSPAINWKSVKANHDDGVYVMTNMLYFEGEDEFKCDVLRTAPIRRLLRAQIAASLVLSDINKFRFDVMSKMAEFRARRNQVANDFDMKRKGKKTA